MTVLMLPFPPSLNGLYKPFEGRLIKTKKHRQYMEAAKFSLSQQRPLPSYDTPVSIHARLGRPDRRKRDLDNHWKGCSDSLMHMGVLADDSLVHKLTLEWSGDVENGVLVEIAPC